MKLRFVSLLVALMLLSTACASAGSAVAPLPTAKVDILSENELNDFFDELTTLGGYVTEDVIRFIQYIYGQLEQKSLNVYGLRFSTTEESNDQYGDYIADFALSTTKPTKALLLGNYGSFLTLPLGIYEITPGEEFRVMADSIFGGGIPYSEVLSSVKIFECAALPITQDVIDAFNSYPNQDKITEMINHGFFKRADFETPTPWNTSLSIELELYPDYYYVNDRSIPGLVINNESHTFTYGDPSVPSTPSHPQTGDNSAPFLWLSMCLITLPVMLMLRKKVYSR